MSINRQQGANLLEKVVQSSPSALILTDSLGRITLVSQSFEGIIWLSV